MNKNKVINSHKNANSRYSNITNSIQDIAIDDYTGNAMWSEVDPFDSSVSIQIKKSGDFNNDYKSQDNFSKSEIDRMISDISSGYIYEDGPDGDEDYTNYVARYSTQGYLAYEKRIPGNSTDRLGYFVFKPEFSKNLNCMVIKVSVLGCIGHKFKYGGKIMYFSDTEDESSDEIDDEYTGPSLNDLDDYRDRNIGEFNPNKYLQLS